MGFKEYLIYFSTLAVAVHHSHGCEMDGVTNWLLPQQLSILDVFEGEFFIANTTSIAGISSTVINQALNRGPYFDFVQSGSEFSIRTNAEYPDYEEYETETAISITVLFNCDGSTLRSMVFIISIEDTNNNDPLFRPTNELEFTVVPPLPPGFQITGCWNDIYARDIDLTTQRVDYEIFDSPYFEIAYDQASSTVPKEFKATLKTTTFIRSIPEPIVFRISATDVDLTNDDRRTTYATITIKGDGEFELPEEPVFSQTFYLGTYTEDHRVILQDTIALRQGYHDEVEFSLEQDYQPYFELVRDTNQVSIEVINPLPADQLLQNQIIIVINAERNLTSGASTAVILKLPEEEVLQFQQPSYQGSIIDNVLHLSEMFLTQGYTDDSVAVEIISEHSQYFTYTVQHNIVTLWMESLPSAVLEQNNLLNLQVVASNSRTSTMTIVTLEIVKDDGVTPVFQHNLYEGTYNLQEGLRLDEIVLLQGYGVTVHVELQGEHSALFGVTENRPRFYLTVSSIPTELFREGSLLLTLVATKPRTVGASTVISIALPADTQLEFEHKNYEGVIEDNVLQVTQLTLTQGYDNDPVGVVIQNDLPHASFFTPTIVNNIVTISMNPLPAEILQANTFLNLQVVASTEWTSASTIVTLEIIKDDYITPVFQRAVYEGTYDPVNGLALEEIVVVQGFDDTVQINLHSDHINYFELDQDGQYMNISVSSLPETLFSERTLILTIEATKPRTVGANAVIFIDLPSDRELSFTAETYSGSLRDGDLTLGTILLSVGYTEDVYFTLSGEYESYFNVSNAGNQVFVTLQDQLPDDVITQNNFLALTLTASALNAVTTSTTIILDIIKEDTNTPQFNQNIFFGIYTGPSSVEIGPIYLTQGYESGVTFRLDGEFSQYFDIDYTENNVTVILQSPIPRQVIFDEKVLTFSIIADKELTVGSVAAVSIGFPDELTHPTALRFSKNVYVGSLEDNSLNLENIVLNHDVTATTEFTLTGEFSSYFTRVVTDNAVTISISGNIPPELLNQKFITLELEVEDSRSVPGTTIIVIDIKQPDAIEQPVFAEAFYRGEYTVTDGFNFEEEISLSEGFDETVTFTLEGEHSQWFTVSQQDNQNLATISMPNPLPNEIIENNNNLLFTVVAIKSGVTPGRAVISIDLPRNITTEEILGFDRINYVGSIIEDSVSLGVITLSEGYRTGVAFDLHGDLSDYFTASAVGPSVSIVLNAPIPQNSIPQNGLILLTLQASAAPALPAFATIVLEVVQDDATPPTPPVFAEPFYVGSYTADGNLVFDSTITLAEGYDQTIDFALEGEHAIWFDITRSEGSVTLILVEPVPAAVVNNNQQLLFTITAQRPGSSIARATIVIQLSEDITTEEILGFDRINYVGSIIEDSVSLGVITLSEGYRTGVAFDLHGDLSDYFTASAVGPSVSIVLNAPIPQNSIPQNGLILLTLQASAAPALPAFATIVLEVVQDDATPPTPPVFAEPFYVGSYTADGNLVFDSTITLAEGYDQTIDFALEGEHAIWFDITRSEGSVTLILVEPVPAAVVNNNQQLLFTITAQRPGSSIARATIVIQLSEDITTEEILGFDRINYVGSIIEDSVSLGVITLSEGYRTGVAFDLHGDLSDYFTASAVGPSVSIVLNAPIPQNSIPQNGLILLTLQASAAPALPAFATIVLEVVQDDATPPTPPVFAEPFYVGSYTADGNLVFDSTITLAEGYDQTIDFALEGEHAIWFDITRSEGSVTLILVEPVPAAVVNNNQQLLFTITAQRPGSSIARATIVIQLSEDITTEEILGFDRINYVGSIIEDSVSLGVITLSEGYRTGVAFDLHGDLSDYFTASAVGPSVSIVLNAPIPQNSIPQNGLILLTLQASAAPALPAFATIVLEVVQDDATPPTPPVFAEPFYVGSYTADGNLVFDSTITLAEGYDQTIDFALEGEHAIWFDITRSEGSVTLILVEPVPAAVVNNNQQLLFTITAQRPGSSIARATIVIQLSEDITTEEILGFDRINYVGSIIEDSVSLGVITLSEGYRTGVAFDLHGDLSDYFTASAVGPSVSIVLNVPIPQNSIPQNGLILLTLQASAAPALPAFATIVLEVVQDDATPPTPPVFAEPFYVGSYTADGNLVFDSTITLTEGYDQTIDFALEGEHAIWFDITRSEGSVTLILVEPVPAAIVNNNQQLLFTITAQRPGSSIARATIVIQLSEDITTEEILGFDRINYVGSIIEDSVSLGVITLSEGYRTGVAFDLHGDLSDYFTASAVGPSVSIVLNVPIPQNSIPQNGLILLTLQASAAPALPAFATIVLEVVQDDATPPTPPVFPEPFYVGSYTADGNLVFDSTITLAEGYDQTIDFALEGEHAIWFDITRSEGSVTLILVEPVPAAVVNNNQQLLFTITAQRPGSSIARATIVIQLSEDITTEEILGFDRINYVGSIIEDSVSLGVITLSEGYRTGVAFDLHGDLSDYFTASAVGPSVSIVLNVPIPQNSIPQNGLILLTLQASAAPALPAFATIVLEVVQDDATPPTPPVFAEPFYVGSYTADGNLVFDSTITLAEGYDQTIDFALEGEHAIWFDITRSEGSVTLILVEPVPAAVVNNNQQLLFTITAQRPGSSIARATIVIQLSEDITTEEILGFDRINYVGSIVEDSVSLGVITLSEGYRTGVAFDLHGDLFDYFTASAVGPSVSIVLNAPIPQNSIPQNGLILLTLRASAAPALPAFATIVLEVVQDDATPPTPPVFAEPFYVGSYTADGNLVFDSTITLAEGYDQTIDFALEGEHAIWFDITRSEGSVTLILVEPVPAAVVNNNQQLLFTITAQRPGSSIARATIVIQLSEDITTEEILGFDRINYVGSIIEDSVSLGVITLSEGYRTGVAFDLHGDLSDYFTASAVGPSVSIVLNVPIPQNSIPQNGLILLTLQASAAPALPAFATIVLEVVQDDATPPTPPVFAEPFYVGSYTADGNLVFDSTITLAEGYDQTIDFALEGEHAIWFDITRSEGSVTLILVEPVPAAVVNNNQQLLFTITAQRPGSSIARATIVIQLSEDITTEEILGFDRINYVGSIIEDSVSLGVITLSEGYRTGVAFDLHGDLSDYFTASAVGPSVSIVLNAPIPQNSIPQNGLILLTLQASAAPALPAFATIVLEVVQDDATPPTPPVFAEPFYVGSYTADGNLVFDSTITLAEGYDQTIDFALEGEHAIWFDITRSEGSVTLILVEPVPAAVVNNNQQLLFTITAQRPGSSIARATIVIQLSEDITTEEILGFDRINYVGSIIEDSVSLGVITLSEGYRTGVAFDLHGDLFDYFTASAVGPSVSIVLNAPIPQNSIPQNGLILLTLRASAAPALPAFATIVLEVVQDDATPPTPPVFAEPFYVGSYTADGNLVFDSTITLAEGYDQTIDFALEGEHAIWFDITRSEGSVTLILVEPVPAAVVNNNQQLLFTITAQRPGSSIARATIVIQLSEDDSSGLFDKVLYEGRIQNGIVQHATITISEYEGTNIELIGVYESLFNASLSDGIVVVQAQDPLTLPPDTHHVVLELRAASSSAVLVLKVLTTEGPVVPTVTFGSLSYAIRVEVGQTGLMGQVQATADNGESITYSLLIDNDHLRTRVSVNSAGELWLSAPANSGVYSFQTVATTVFSQATGYATIHMSVEAITVCGNEIVTPPLIVIDRDEEEPLRDLVVLNAAEHVGCQYTLTNKWPITQNWLYVDETGLHATAIDREDPSIAFMALSQVQVELVLTCDSDVTRTKRSIDGRLDWLGPYDYGTNTWLLGQTIQFNSRRSIVNLIVNDINDNTPIFIGKENEPIVVGYPVPELEATILPRSLAELQATDADVGINAALVYWSSEPELAVSPTTGFVHVTNDQRLEHDKILTVNATDLNGQGLTGSISLMVKLLDSSNVAVVTVSGAFLEDENNVLGNISNSIGYEVRSLRSVVVSDTEEELSLRMNRNTTTPTASLEIYVYGLVQAVAVSAERLKTDINNAEVVAVSIANIQSLEDHLDSRLTCDEPGRDVGLLAATIVLSILLFILIVAIVVWFILTRTRKQNYDQFSDANSLASRNESLDQPKPLDSIAVTKPRLNIEELKRSEKRLQDMLNAPIEPEASTSNNETGINSVAKANLPDPIAPIVIQDKLKDAVEESDDDEFGERRKPRRKSVVTFNENVEKIIHVNEEPDGIADSNYEVYKL